VAILILLGGAVVLTALFIFLRSHTDQMARDFDRLADMHVLRASFERLYQDQASYEVGNCEEGTFVHECLLFEYDPNIVIRRDPGVYAYQIVEAPSVDSFTISFYLEGSYRNLTAGEHFLTEDGIQ